MNNQTKERSEINKWSPRFKRSPPWRKLGGNERLGLFKEAKKRFDAKKSADELSKLVSQGKAENVDLIKTLLDRLWRQSMNGGILNDEIIRAAQKFIRDVEASQKGQK